VFDIGGNDVICGAGSDERMIRKCVIADSVTPLVKIFPLGGAPRTRDFDRGRFRRRRGRAGPTVWIEARCRKVGGEIGKHRVEATGFDGCWWR